MSGARLDDINIPRAQRRPPAQLLDVIAKAHPERDTAMRAAWRPASTAIRRSPLTSEFISRRSDESSAGPSRWPNAMMLDLTLSILGPCLSCLSFHKLLF